eukprot:COSAG02_NODE_2_length_75708_cov_87.013953_12_plen_133_part_00
MGRKEKIFELAKGYRGRAKNCITASRARVEKGLQYAYRDRRTKKREFRSLWITRINAGVRGECDPVCAASSRVVASASAPRPVARTVQRRWPHAMSNRARRRARLQLQPLHSRSEPRGSSVEPQDPCGASGV